MSTVVVAAVVVVAAAAGWTTATLAGEDEGEEGATAEGAVPGVPYTGGSDAPAPEGPGGGGFEPIVTAASTFDPTILTKFIPALAFVAAQGDAGGVSDDRVVLRSGVSCFRPADVSGGTATIVSASIELPDGARIKQIVAYGEDSDNSSTISVWLYRTDLAVLGGSVTRSESTVTSFTSLSVFGEFALASTDNLAEVTGSFGGLPTTHRFHSVTISMNNVAGINHVLCGVEVLYQVPAVATAAGTVFYPINPVRAFDSRIATYTNSGLLAPNGSKVISISDGHDSAGVVNEEDVVPAGATAVAYNITVTGPTGPNFLAVTAGDAGSFTASAINFNGTADIANAAIVAIATNRTIKIWGGNQSGSTHVIIDITGFYAPIPNMAN